MRREVGAEVLGEGAAERWRDNMEAEVNDPLPCISTYIQVVMNISRGWISIGQFILPRWAVYIFINWL